MSPAVLASGELVVLVQVEHPRPQAPGPGGLVEDGEIGPEFSEPPDLQTEPG